MSMNPISSPTIIRASKVHKAQQSQGHRAMHVAAVSRM